MMYAGLPAALVAMAVLAWCMRRVKLPEPLQIIEKLGSYSVSGEDMKTLGKRLEALNIPVSPELYAAAKTVITVILVLTGLFLLLDRHIQGVLLLFAAPMAGRLPELFLELREKKRKELMLRDFPLMVDQVRIYARAAGYFQALKIASYATKGVLGREMAVLSAELELTSFKEAMNNFAGRCGIPEIADFARILVVEQATGADIGDILLNCTKMARQRQVSKIKRKIKIQPILMSILPGVLLIMFVLMFIIPMVTNIITQLNAIK